MTALKSIAVAAALISLAGTAPAQARGSADQASSRALARGSSFARAPMPVIGYTIARVETTVAIGPVEISDRESRNGRLLGAGVERKFLHPISGRLEFRYSDLSEGDGAFARHRILMGIAYRF